MAGKIHLRHRRILMVFTAFWICLSCYFFISTFFEGSTTFKGSAYKDNKDNKDSKDNKDNKDNLKSSIEQVDDPKVLNDLWRTEEKKRAAIVEAQKHIIENIVTPKGEAKGYVVNIPEFHEVYMTQNTEREYEFFMTLQYGKQICVVVTGNSTRQECDQSKMQDVHSCNMNLKTKQKKLHIASSRCKEVVR